MASLDIGTVLVLHGTSLLAGAGTLLFVRHRAERPSGLGTIAAGFILLAGGALLAGLGEIGAIADIVWRNSSAAVGAAAYVLFFIGVRDLDRPSNHLRWLLLIPSAILGLGLVTSVFESNTTRATLFHATAATANFAAAFSILAGRRSEPLPARVPLFWTLLACGTVYGVQVPLLQAGWSDPSLVAAGLGVTMMLNFMIAALLVSFVRERREETHRRASHRDALTGIFNRRGFLGAVPDELAAGAALALFDLDHFKTINDRFGHAAGDHALSSVARLIEGHLRTGEVVARIGGEEFVVYLPDAWNGQAVRRVDEIRMATRAMDLRWMGERMALATSVGLAVSATVRLRNRDALLAIADAALYRAKASGRDRVVVAAADEGSGTHHRGAAEAPLASPAPRVLAIASETGR